ncbi:GNAT family N-acetyltransferase [Kitasatospora acidiphila]|uniref:GNAT family N-acetyltransferase n=1 Tax=Kitasatospora acidiphila TaxID=2567942 RepID=A0A540WC95_9ACTN|nr:GNAT family N-acetyltransferase [Kitasatospora acidiphila]TQF06669.1 GNAT family N-acetyltransferase [Kitasatospora acidiphila]
MEIQPASGIADVEADWLAVADSLYALPNWLKTAETRDGGRRLYALSFDGGKATGALAAYPVHADSWVFNNPVALLTGGSAEFTAFLDAGEQDALQRAQEQLGAAADELFPTLASFLPSGYRPGVLRSPAADARTTEALLDHLEETAARDGQRTVAVMHVPEDDQELRGRLRARGYLPFVAVGDCELATPWRDFDGYLAALPSPRRNRVRREIRGFAESGAQLREGSIEAMGDRHAELHAGHLRRYGHRTGIADSLNLLKGMRENPTGRGRVLEAWRAGELVGFVVAYEFNGRLHPKMIGVAEGERAAFGYFNITYYGLIRLAVAEGLRAIGFGPEAYEAKALRGCALQRLVCHLRVPQSHRQVAAVAAEIIDRAQRRRLDSFQWAASR